MTSLDKKKLVIFGGTFDPPHIGHVLTAAYAVSSLRCDQLLVIPTWEHPLGKKIEVPFEHRFRMCELAFEPIRRVEISRIEEELSGPSRTLRTLEELLHRHPHTALRLVMGADLVDETPKWHAFDRIRALAPPIIIGRAGYPTSKASPISLPDISSTEIRMRLAQGDTVDGLIPKQVAEYALANRLYT